VFALANAGVVIGGDIWEQLRHPVSLGIILGLVLGKQVGILGGALVAVRSGFAQTPGGVSWTQIYGTGWLAGIGFTMAIFIANLVFGGTDLLDTAKTAILIASAVSGVVGWAILRLLPRFLPTR
jgi:Na+:H+ antiporter, NhaA family